MKLDEIAYEEIPCRSSLMPNAEAEFDAACKAIESGDWGKAYEIASLLTRQTLPSELADAVRIMSDILNPANTSNETAQKIVQFLPGRLLRVYDDRHGWHEDALRELVDV